MLNKLGWALSMKLDRNICWNQQFSYENIFSVRTCFYCRKVKLQYIRNCERERFYFMVCNFCQVNNMHAITLLKNIGNVSWLWDWCYVPTITTIGKKQLVYIPCWINITNVTGKKCSAQHGEFKKTCNSAQFENKKTTSDWSITYCSNYKSFLRQRHCVHL